MFSERLGGKLLAGRLPAFEKALGRAMDGISSTPLRFAARAGTGWAQEGVQEIAQGYVDEVVLDLGHALGMDVKDRQWLGEGGVFDGDFAANLDTFVQAGPLAVAGAAKGLAREARIRAFIEASDDAQLAIGIQPDAVDKIRKAKGPEEQEAEINRGSEQADPQSETASDASHRLMQQVEDVRIDAEDLKAEGVVPPVTRLRDGTWVARDQDTGEELVRTKDLSGASRLMEVMGGEVPSPAPEAGSGMDKSVRPLPPIGPGRFEIKEAPAILSFKDDLPATVTEPSRLRKVFWDMFDAVSSKWPKVIQLAEGPVTWSKSLTGYKLRSFKNGEPARLHYIASQNLPALLENSRLAAVETELKGDRTVQEVHRRYAWAEFPDGTRRHVLLTINRMSEEARPELKSEDQAYSAEVLGVMKLEVLPVAATRKKESADVVNLEEPHPETGIGDQAVTSTRPESNLFLSGIKPEHRWEQGKPADPSRGDSDLSGDSIGERFSQMNFDPRSATDKQKQRFCQKMIRVLKQRASKRLKVVKDREGNLSLETVKQKGKSSAVELFADELTFTREERFIIKAPWEILPVYEANGRLYSVTGGESRDNVKIPKDLPHGAILTHNHTSGRGPSDSDLKLIFRRPHITLRIAIERNEQGRQELFSLKANPGFNPSDVDACVSFYKEAAFEFGDTHQSRRNALRLTAKEFPNMILFKNRILP